MKSFITSGPGQHRRLWSALHMHVHCSYLKSMHLQLLSGASGLNFGQHLHLHPYFVYVTSKGSERLCGHASSFEPWLLANTLSSKTSCFVSNINAPSEMAYA